jgi:hypothetical protein
MLLVAFAATLVAQDFRSSVGLGGQTCAEWSSHRHKSGVERKLDQQWLFGFLSGANFTLAKDEEHKLLWPSDDPRNYVDFIDHYCADHQKEVVQYAAFALIRELKAKGGL